VLVYEVEVADKFAEEHETWYRRNWMMMRRRRRGSH
jgi:hypothetical protein